MQEWDRIQLDGMQFYAYHGLFPEENRLGQLFTVDVELFLSLSMAGKSDDVQETVDYARVMQTVRGIMEGEPRRLVERLAEEIAQKTLADFPLVQGVRVRVAKPHPPIPGHYRQVAVEICRCR